MMDPPQVQTISRLAQWRIVDDFGTFTGIKRSEPFKMGMWNWRLSFEKKKNGWLYIRLFLEQSRLSEEQPPIAKFVVRVASTTGINRRVVGSIVVWPKSHERLLRTTEDFVWTIDHTIRGGFHSPNGEEASFIGPNDGKMLKSSAIENILRCLSRMLHESIDVDVTINTCDGTLKAHKAILSGSSPVFHSMFQHDRKEKQTSTINIHDMSLESCTALVSYLYGTIKQEDFWKHRIALLGAANKYAVSGLKDLCDESLIEDITTDNVLDRLQEAWLYQLDKLKKGCLTYLFEFGKVCDIRDEVNDFLRSAERESVQEIIQEMLTTWKPV